ncbi:MAG: molybdate ABC transporter permease subunit [Anaerolineaceae bacterium]|nr:molybdate ABC transporter permease subunit [Anaerolineaceae bacterium]
MKTNIRGIGGWLLLALVILYVGFLIAAPIGALVKGAFQEGFSAAWQSLSSAPFLQSLWLSIRIAIGVVLVQAIFGSLTAWMLVRQKFFGKALINGLLDIPFALSPVVVGYMLLLLFGRNGHLGTLLDALDIQIAFAVPGMFLATLFVSLPFMIREMTPVIQQLDLSQESAAATLGASRWRIFWQVIFPQLKTALIYGMTLTFARALGEFGAVLVIGGGVQGRTETATLYIFRSLDERQYTDAYVAAIVLGLFSVLLVLIADALKRKRSQAG